MHQGEPLVSVLVLVSLHDQELPSVIGSWPRGKVMNDVELPYFLGAVSIDCKDRGNPHYCFNTPLHYCYPLYFEVREQTFALVCVSKYPFVNFFKAFLGRVSLQFDASADFLSDAKNRMSFVGSLIAQWPNNGVPDTLSCSLPGSVFQWTFGPEDFWFQGLDATVYFTVQECFTIWSALMRADPILIIGNDDQVTTDALFAALSLIGPLRFEDPICAWLTVTDPRFVEVIGGNSGLAVAATNIESLAEAASEFKYVFKVPEARRTSVPEVATKLRLRTRRTVNITAYALDNMMLYDAYCDIVESPLYTEEFANELKEYENYDLPTAEDFRRWEKTQTFRLWRKKRDSYDSFRESLLGNDPEVALRGKTRRQLLVIENRLSRLRGLFARDRHARCVLARNMKYLKKLLDDT